jgi:hypothetical protein
MKGIVVLLAALADAAPAPAPAPEAAEAAAAEPAEEEGEYTGPAIQVTVGVYVNQILGMDLKAGTFTADFWLWFRWKGGPFEPHKSFEVLGGRVESKESEIEQDLEDGVKYAAIRVVATIKQPFDVSRFPLDHHTLSITIEDGENETHKVVYLADTENSRLDPSVAVPGYNIAAGKTALSTHTYTTNFGDTSLPSDKQSTYSKYEFRIDLVRPGIGYTLKLFWGIYLATMIALLAFFIKPTDLDPRFGLGIGAVFAAMASAYIVSSALPETNTTTLADHVNMLAIGYIFLSLVGSTVSLRMFAAGREVGSRRLDMASFWVLLVSYTVLNAMALF